MHVFAKDRKIASFRVGFGYHPVGHKQQEGDKRTPEGRYVLDYKNANSTFFTSIHISYPNAADKANDPKVRVAIDRFASPDWTYGCISMKNEDLQRLWGLVSVPTPIHIQP